MSDNDTSKDYDDCIGKKDEKNVPSDLNSFFGVTLEDEVRENWNDPEKQWLAGGMPEFDSSSPEKPYHQVYLRFRSEEDMQKFAELVDQQLNKTTKTIWYPAQEREKNILNQWVEEN